MEISKEGPDLGREENSMDLLQSVNLHNKRM